MGKYPKVLLIANYFPPRNHVASRRTQCFYKYLPDHGWEAHVLAPDRPSHFSDYDEKALGALPYPERIHLVKPPPDEGIWNRSILKRLGPYLAPAWAPNQLARPMLKEALSIVERHQFDAIWATSDPILPLSLAETISRKYKLPWIADMRDSALVQPQRNSWKHSLNKKTESRLCQSADATCFVTGHLSRKLEDILNIPIHLIENGFDPEAFKTKERVDKDYFIISHTGAIHSSPMNFFHSLESLIDSKKIEMEKLKVLFYGTPRNHLFDGLDELKVEKCVEFIGVVPHHQIVLEQQRSSLLVVFNPAHYQGAVSGKIFDYVAAQRTILAYPPGDIELTKILQTTEAGVFSSSVLEDADFILRKYHAWQSDSDSAILDNDQKITHYSRHHQAGQLADLLNQVRYQK